MDNKQINTKQYLLKITKNTLLGILSVIITILAIAFVVTILEQREIAMREMQGISDNRMLPAYMIIFIMGIIYLINSIIIMIPSIIFIIYRKLTKNWKNIFYALIIYIITLLLFFKFVLPFIGIFLFIYYFSSYALYIHIAIALIIFWFMLPKLNDF